MLNSNLFKVFILCICTAVSACARSDSPGVVTAAAEIENAAESNQTQSAAATIQSFTTVEGADLAARLEAASQRARSGKTAYWSAYAFDVRPGVAVDPGMQEFHGSMNTIGDTTVFVGKI